MKWLRKVHGASNMAIIIDIDLPKSCTECPISLNYLNVIYCKSQGDFVKGKTKRPKSCPIRGKYEHIA